METAVRHMMDNTDFIAVVNPQFNMLFPPSQRHCIDFLDRRDELPLSSLSLGVPGRRTAFIYISRTALLPPSPTTTTTATSANTAETKDKTIFGNVLLGFSTATSPAEIAGPDERLGLSFFFFFLLFTFLFEKMWLSKSMTSSYWACR